MSDSVQKKIDDTGLFCSEYCSEEKSKKSYSEILIDDPTSEVPELIHSIQVNFEDPTKLLTVHDPIL